MQAAALILRNVRRRARRNLVRVARTEAAWPLVPLALLFPPTIVYLLFRIGRTQLSIGALAPRDLDWVNGRIWELLGPSWTVVGYTLPLLSIAALAAAACRKRRGSRVAALAGLALLSIIPLAATFVGRNPLRAAYGDLGALYRATGRLAVAGDAVPALGPTPSQPPCGRTSDWSEHDLRRFRVLNFKPMSRRFSFQVIPVVDTENDGATVVLRAISDLNCDFEHELIEMTMQVRRTPAAPELELKLVGQRVIGHERR